jgi:hypothetical protein
VPLDEVKRQVGLPTESGKRARMTSWRTALLHGLLVWLIPFLVAFAAFPLKASWRSLFESIMPLTLCVVVVMCAGRYFRRIAKPSVIEGVGLGLLWFAICVAIDLPLMLSPPMSYSLAEYAADIALTYLTIPVITTGMALAASKTADKPA